MRKKYSRRFNKDVLVLMPGEYFASKDPVIICTLLGSCISACIFDIVNKIGGINHFMLPGRVDPDNFIHTKGGRYGMYAMELLIGNLIKLGAARKNLRAKIFGGSNVLNFRKTEGDVSSSNIQFSKKFLEMEQVPLLNMDVGGSVGRKIFFFTDTGRVLSKKLIVTSTSEVIREELRYKRNLFRKRIEDSSSTIFDI